MSPEVKDAIDYIINRPPNEADVLLRNAKMLLGEIDSLRDQIRDLNALVKSEGERIHKQSELPSKKAEGGALEADLQAVIAERDKAERIVKKLMDFIGTVMEP